jgi:integrase
MPTKRRGHGEGSIYQRRDARWVGSLTLEDGKRKYFYGKTRREVQEKLRVALNEQKQGMLATGPQQTVKHYLEYWLEEVHRPTVRLGTYTEYRKVIDGYILPDLGHIQMQKLTVQQVQALYTRKLKDGYAARTVRLLHAILHKALSHAVRIHLVSRNVCDLVSPPRVAGQEMQSLTIEQAQRLLTAARGCHLEALLTLAIATGMREGELLALRWSDVSFEKMFLQVCRTVRRIPGHGHVESEPKTQKSRRKITLTPHLVEVLKEHRVRQEEARRAAGFVWKEQNLVFCNRRGNFIEPSELFRSFQKLLKEAGLPRMRFHDLRHSAASILLVMGVHPKVVQELLGHSNIAMTLNIYSHVLPSLQQEAMERLSDLLSRQDDQGDGRRDREGGSEDAGRKGDVGER